MAEITLEGLDEMLERIKKISERVAGRTVNKALNAGADVLVEEMSRQAPQKPGAKYATGRLSRSITKSKVKIKKGIKYIAVGPSKDIYYAHFLEFGTSKMSASPFMTPSLEAKRSEINAAMADVLRKELKRLD